MKKIQNKTTEIPNGDKKATYIDLLKVILNQQQQSGFSINDIKRRLSLIEILDSANGEIHIENADYEYLMSLVTAMKWGIISPDIIQFVKDIEEAK